MAQKIALVKNAPSLILVSLSDWENKWNPKPFSCLIDVERLD